MNSLLASVWKQTIVLLKGLWTLRCQEWRLMPEPKLLREKGNLTRSMNCILAATVRIRAAPLSSNRFAQDFCRESFLEHTHS